MIEQKTERTELGVFDTEPDQSREAVLSDWLAHARSPLRGEGWKSAVLVIRLKNHQVLEEAFSIESIETVMEEMGRRIRERVPAGCDVVSWAARELAILPRRSMSLSSVHRLATALRCQLDLPLSISGLSVLVLTVIGAVQIDPSSLDSATTIVSRLDLALAQAARFNEDRFAVYDHRRVESARCRLEIQSALRAALHNEELTLAYQPIRDLTTKKVVALEALARWHDPRLGDIPPSQFLPAAEQAGLIGVLEKWVVRTACRQLFEWRELGYFDLMMSVNVSAAQFTSREFGLEEPILRALEMNGLPPAALQIEITEAAVGEDAERTMLRSIRRLSQMGSCFVIDDFGTGHSSLSRLHRLPVQGIKIDRSFVQGLSRSENSQKVVAAIIALAAELGLVVIAEGVERNSHRRTLSELGCSLGQGYLLGRPLSAQDIPDVLSSK